MTAFIDALGRTVEVTGRPARIVSLVPSITQALFAFGLGDAIAGVTRFCVDPPEGVAGKPKVGGTKTLDVERTLAIGPDLVIANAEENRREDIERLIAAGLTVYVTFPRTVADAIEMLRQLASMTGAEAAARPILATTEDELRRALSLKETRGAVRVFCPIWRRPWMTIGPDTYMHDFLSVCGAHNVFADSADRYPRIELEQMAARQPEAVLLPDEPYRFAARHIPELSVFPEVPAVQNERIYLVEGKHLCWYGSRIAEGLRTVQKLLWR